MSQGGNVWPNLRHLSTRKEWLKSSISNALLRLPLMTGWICKSASWQIYFKIELLKQCQTCNSDPKQNCIFKFEIQNTSKKSYDIILLAFQFWLHQKFSWVKIICCKECLNLRHCISSRVNRLQCNMVVYKFISGSYLQLPKNKVCQQIWRVQNKQDFFWKKYASGLGFASWEL